MRWIGLALFGLFLVVGVRLIDLQILHGGAYEEMASENRVRIRLIPPLRGRILDGNGRVLAEDRPCWAVAVDFHRIVPPEQIADAIADAWDVEGADVAEEIGTGWGDAWAPQVRTVRRRKLLALLETLSPVVHRPFADLVRAVREAEDRILERERRERVRVAGLLLASETMPRGEVRERIRTIEEALEAEMKSAVPEGAFLLATGIRWDRVKAFRSRRLEAYRSVAALSGDEPPRFERRIAELDRACSRRILESMRSEEHVLVEGHLPYGVIATLETEWESFPGVTVQVRPGRRYPEEIDGCHVVGYVGYLGWRRRGDESVNVYEEREEEGFFFEPLEDLIDRETYERMEKRGAFHHDLFGKAGVERLADAGLRGRRGARIVERDRRNRIQRTLRLDPPAHGGTVRLTVDVVLQRRVREAFARARPALPAGTPVRGAAVVLDVETGAVRALVSVPGYDPNELTPPVSAASAKRYLSGEGKPLLNRAIRGRYPAGSTFKVVAALAALEEGVVDPEDEIECEGSYAYGPQTFHCWNRHGHGPLKMVEALERSCNVYFYVTGRELGSALRRWAEYWGFGSPTGLDLPGEKGGQLPPGRGGDWVQLAIGQRMTATPLQVARMMAAVANGGRFLIPHVRKDAGGGPDGQAPLVSPRSLAVVREGLRRVVHGEHGTAALPSLIEAKAAGKTGTAETGRTVDGVETNHAWFAGYAPYDDPKVSVAVVIESVPDGVHGGEAAGPVAGAIFRAALAEGEE